MTYIAQGIPGPGQGFEKKKQELIRKLMAQGMGGAVRSRGAAMGPRGRMGSLSPGFRGGFKGLGQGVVGGPAASLVQALQAGGLDGLDGPFNPGPAPDGFRNNPIPLWRPPGLIPQGPTQVPQLPPSIFSGGGSGQDYDPMGNPVTGPWRIGQYGYF